MCPPTHAGPMHVRVPLSTVPCLRRAQYGGAIFNYKGTMKIVRLTFDGNTATVRTCVPRPPRFLGPSRHLLGPPAGRGQSR